MWEALTEPERLEEWFATEVELDARPGGLGVFRWGDGDERHAIVVDVEPERRLALRFDDDGAVEIAAGAGAGGHARGGHRERPELRARAGAARAGRMGDRVGPVFSALADPSRRFVVETLADAGLGDGDRARRRAAGDAAGRGEAPRGAGRRGPRRPDAAGPRDALPAERRSRWPTPCRGSSGVGAQWDARLTALAIRSSGYKHGRRSPMIAASIVPDCRRFFQATVAR